MYMSVKKISVKLPVLILIIKINVFEAVMVQAHFFIININLTPSEKLLGSTSPAVAIIIAPLVINLVFRSGAPTRP